ASWRAMTGHSLRELKTVNVDATERMLERLILSDLPIRETVKIESSESGIRWQQADLRVIRAAAWTFGYILTLFDITDEIKPKAILESLMDSTTDIISIVNPNGTIEYVSRTLVEALGFDSWRSLVNRPWEQLFENTGEMRKKMTELFSGDSLADIQTGPQTLYIDTPEGTTVLNYRTNELNYQDENFGFLSIATNTTDLVTAREQAESAMRAKAAFLANMTHELRTPMNAVLGINELLSRTSLTPLQRNYVAQVRSSASLLLSVINDILDFSRIEAKKMTLVNEPYKVMDLLQDVINLISVRMNEKELSFTVTIDPDVPSVLVGDTIRIKQLLINLLGNAVKFTGEGGVVLELSASRVGETAMVHLSVMDTGIGIPKIKQAELFKEFSRVDNTTVHSVEGSGLGLAICRGLVNLMGGTLTLESDTGKGSTFTAIFPQGLCPDSSPVADLSCSKTVKLLVYDRDPATRKSIASMAEQAGIDFDVCTDSLSFTRTVSGGTFPWTHVVFEYGAAYNEVLTLAKKYPSVRWLSLLSLSDFIGSGKDPGVSFLFKPLLVTGFASFIRDEYVDFSTSMPMVNTLGISPQLFHAENARVLVVDDNAINRKVVEGFLKTFDIAVDEAASGFEALEKASRNRYDLVLMDHVMPEISGVETVSRLRGQDGYEDVPIIMLTANTSGEHADMYRSVKIDDILHKPIEFSLFVACMQKWLKTQPADQVSPDMPELPFAEPADKHASGDKQAGGDKPWIPSLDRDKAVEYTGSEKNLAIILKVFARSSPKLLDALEKTHDGSDRSAYRTAAHSLISVVGNIGGTELSARFRELEQAILHEKDAVAAELYPGIRDDLARLIDDVREYVG
ncbi:MAG TPA: ATP-binding protein, partial [Treponemataceae bacterium]|nr:ATP-binding protein [Treponemataceae bacterium]